MSTVALVDEERWTGGAADVLGSLLDDLAALLLTVPTESYAARPLPGVSGSVGEHVRHILDHVSALIGLAPGATLNYDNRQRGTSVESDPGAGLRAIMRLKAALANRLAMEPDTPVDVISRVSSAGESIGAWSTVAREVAFVISHTIHHQALIAALLAVQGRAVPDRFGYAPSTPAAPAS